MQLKKVKRIGFKKRCFRKYKIVIVANFNEISTLQNDYNNIMNRKNNFTVITKELFNLLKEVKEKCS